MKIVKSSDTIFLKEFSSLKKISNGEALPSSYYDITEPISFDVLGIDSNVIQSSNEFQVGEEILVSDKNGIFKKNIITAKSGENAGSFLFELINDIHKVKK